MRVDGVVVAAPVSLARDAAGVGELDHDAVRGARGDPDPLADVAQTDPGVMRCTPAWGWPMTRRKRTRIAGLPA